MIRVTVRLRDALPVRIDADGHGLRGFDGQSAPCAAVSAVLKGLGLVLVEAPQCTVDGSVDQAGRYRLIISDCGDPHWMRGVWDSSRTTLQEIAREWPGEVNVSIIEENNNGT